MPAKIDRKAWDQMVQSGQTSFAGLIFERFDWSFSSHGKMEFQNCHFVDSKFDSGSFKEWVLRYCSICLTVLAVNVTGTSVNLMDHFAGLSHTYSIIVWEHNRSG